MEVYYYRCPICGYVHQVPGYWMSYAPEEAYEQMHFAPEKGAVCENQMLDYAGEGDEG
ncbi:MAG: hypothetical protein Q4F18_00235 [Clostridia bacterium]|nr:hypothetical protein [Clostridia bacterium]